MTALDLLTPESQTIGSGAAQSRDSTIFESFAAGAYQGYTDNIMFRTMREQDLLGEREKLVRERFGSGVDELTAPMVEKRKRPLEARIFGGTKDVEDRTAAKARSVAFDDLIAKGRAEDPDQWRGIKTSQEIEAEIVRGALDAQETSGDITARSGTTGKVAHFAGQMLASVLTDPINLMTLPFGAAGGTGVLRAVGTEALINAGIETAQIPFRKQWKDRLDQRYGLREAAADIALAGGGAAGLTALIRGAPHGVSFVLDRASKSKTLRAEERDAAQYMSRVEHIDEQNPFTNPTREEHWQHRELVERTQEAFRNYEQPDFSGIRVDVFPDMVERASKRLERNADAPFIVRSAEDAVPRADDRDPYLMDYIQEGIARMNAPRGKANMAKPIIDFLRSYGGVRVGSVIDGELRHMGITPKTAPGLFKKNSGLKDFDNIAARDFYERTGVEPRVSADETYVDRDYLLAALRDESFGKTIHDTKTRSFDDEFDEIITKAGADVEKHTPEEIHDLIEAADDNLAAIRKHAADNGYDLTREDITRLKQDVYENPDADIADLVDDYIERSAIQDVNDSAEMAYLNKPDTPFEDLKRDADILTSKEHADAQDAEFQAVLKTLREGTEDLPEMIRADIEDILDDMANDEAVYNAVRTCAIK